MKPSDTAAAAETRQAGAIAFRKRLGVTEVVLVRPSSGQAEWLFPKGHIEPGEAEAQTAMRELREEAGVVGSLVGAVDLVSRFESKGERVAVRFYVAEAVRIRPPKEQRAHTWLPLALAAEALHEHNRRILAEALPIIEGHLTHTGRGDEAFQQFLLAELQHTTESFIKSEEDGEHRAKFFLTLVAGAGAVLAFVLGDRTAYQPDQIAWPVVLVLVALLAVGNFVLRRIAKRNKTTDEYKEHLRRMRGWFTPNRHDPRRAWVAFDPFREPEAREFSYWGPKTGGWVEMVLLVNAMLAGILVGALVPTSDWLQEGLVAAAGAIVTWVVLVGREERVAGKRSGKAPKA
jgi:8-oxo-dGTP pyrophosphatase MutT (NUDIX family)